MPPIPDVMPWFSYAYFQSSSVRFTKDYSLRSDQLLVGFFKLVRGSQDCIRGCLGVGVWNSEACNLMNSRGIQCLTPCGIRSLLLGAQRTKPQGGVGGKLGEGLGGERTVWEKDKSPKMLNREAQDPCWELTTAKLKRLGRKRINKDKRTGDFKWLIWIEGKRN